MRFQDKVILVTGASSGMGKAVALAAAAEGASVLLANRDREAGEAVAKVLADWPEPVSIVVSSDMSHFVTDENARKLDKLAIDKALALDPAGLYSVVRGMDISMCGVLPMTMGLAAAKALGASRSELVAYATSGEVGGDYAQVVGYAGILVS
jgi:hypothetical protein